MFFVRTTATTIIWVFVFFVGLGLAYWGRTILKDPHHWKFFGYDYNQEILAGALGLWIIGWGLMIGSVVGEVVTLFGGSFEWACSRSMWVRVWWDGALCADARR
jgi:hypothetical protein